MPQAMMLIEAVPEIAGIIEGLTDANENERFLLGVEVRDALTRAEIWVRMRKERERREGKE